MPTGERTSNLALPAGTMLFEYRLERMLGKGGFGLTYLAVDVELGRKVAIKELLPDGIAMRGEGTTVVAQTDELEETFQWASERFLEEARTLARMSQPNIVKVIRYLKANQTVYMVMDFIQGQGLDQVVKANGGALPEAQVRAILTSLLSGVDYIHSQEVLHRDIKPANVLVTPDGTPVLIDFGSARENLGRTVAMTSVVSFGYSPWEQIMTNGRQGPWTDIHALAATTIHMMTGRVPKSAADRLHEPEPDGWLVEQLGDRYSETFLRGVEWGFRVQAQDRPQSVAQWREYFDQLPAAQPASALVPKAVPVKSAAQLPPSAWTGLAPQPASTPPMAVPPQPFWKKYMLELAGGGLGLVAVVVLLIAFWPHDKMNNVVDNQMAPTVIHTPESPAQAIIAPPQKPEPVAPPPTVTPPAQVAPTTPAETPEQVAQEEAERQKEAAAQAEKIFQQGLTFYRADARDVPDKDDQAFAKFHEAAALGHPSANGYLAYFYAKNRGGRYDLSKAEEYAKKNPNDAFSQYVLGTIYFHTDRKAEAGQQYELSANQGCVEGETAYGQFLCEKKGDQDVQEGINWLEKASAQNDAGAQFDLYYFYKESAPEKAMSYLRLAAAHGNPVHESLLGELLAKQQNPEADSWFKKAQSDYETQADNGSGMAQFALGMMLKKGQGSPQNPANDQHAIAYFKKALATLEQDEPSATQQYLLGRIYQGGLDGNHPDPAAARKYYTQAAAQGNTQAQELLNSLPPSP